jgi:hypothetical protein
MRRAYGIEKSLGLKDLLTEATDDKGNLRISNSRNGSR